MKNLRLSEASIRDLDKIRALYWRLLDSSPKYGEILQWKKNIYPNEDDWNKYIVKGEMYLILKDRDAIGAVAVTNAQSKEYRKIYWKVKADDQEVGVVHLLMILPEYQGDGAATAALDEIIKLAAGKKKRAVEINETKSIGNITFSTFANDTNLTTKKHLFHNAILVVITMAYTLILIRTLPKNQWNPTNNVVSYCKDSILNPQCHIVRQGKNWYCEIGNTRITVNAYSYTIITTYERNGRKIWRLTE